MLLLLEEIKQQNQTQLVLIQQLLSQPSAPSLADCDEDFDLPVRCVEQLLKLETDCGDPVVKGKLVSLLLLLAGMG